MRERAELAAFAGIALSVIGMMLVVAGVVTSGLFLPGVVLIGLSALAFAAAGLLHALEPD